jgi:DNA-binding GntR family transcriptional regulator
MTASADKPGGGPVKQGAQGSAAGTGIPHQGVCAARVPHQQRGAEGERGVAGDGDAAVRGEHPAAEAPLPRPRAAEPSVEQPRHAVQRSSVRGQILAALRTALVTGELTPGTVYSAPALGERFGVSATPVREAMQQLAQEGAVEVVPNRGFRVVQRDARELAELAEVRALLEVPVLLRLADTVAAERWAELRPLAEATVRAASGGCRAAYAEADRAFHRAVLSLAGNEQLVRIADDLHRRAQWPRGTGRHVRAELMADAAQHAALLDALAHGDGERVRLLVGEHFRG